MDESPEHAEDTAPKRSILGSLPWAGLGDVSLIASSAIGLLVAARFVPPEEFGLLGFAAIVVRTVELFTSTGLDRAAIQRAAFSERQLEIYWTTQVARGALVSLIVVALAKPIVLFFHQPRAWGVVSALAALVTIKGLANPVVVRWQRELDYRRLFVLQLIRGLTRGGMLIGFAIAWRSVWALVVSELTAAALHTLASHVMAGRLPRPRWDRAEVAALFRFGRWITGMAIVSLIMDKSDDLYVTYALGAAATAFYQLAFEVANSPTTRAGSLISGVAFPAFSRLHDRPALRRRMLLAVLQASATVSFALAVFLVNGVPAALRIILPPEWEPAIPVTLLLTIPGTLRSLLSPATAYAMAVGRPDLEVRMNIPRVVVLLALLVPMKELFGLVGVALAVNLAVATTLPTWGFIMVKIAGVSMREIAGVLARPTLSAALLYAALYGVRLLAPEPAVELALVAVTAGALVGGFVWLDRRGSWPLLAPFRDLREKVH